MSATYLATAPLRTPINAGITSQNNNIFVFSYDLNNGFPTRFDSSFLYVIEFHLLSTANTSDYWYIVTDTSGGSGVYVSGSDHIEPFSFNLPAQGGVQTIWYSFDFGAKNFNIGINSPVGTDGITVTIPEQFQNVTSYDAIEVLLYRYHSSGPENGSYSTAPLTNFYYGNMTELTCLNLTNQQQTIQPCVAPMTSFCTSFPNHPQCACISAPNNPTYAEEIRLIGPTVPYQCWTQPCVDGTAFNPTDTDHCPQQIEICEQVFNLSGTNNSIKNTNLYQQCEGQYGPPGSDNFWKYVIIATIILIFIIIVLLLIFRKKL